MSGWVLIFYLAGYKSGGAATAEFHTQESCVAAIEQIERESRGLFLRFAVCVKK